MADPTVHYDPITKRIIRTDPPALKALIQPVSGTSLVAIPTHLYDLENNFRAATVQARVELPKKK